jgi:ketosteroid isomerase-like protein
MSESNVNAVKDAYRSFERGDMDGVMKGMAPDVDWSMTGQEGHFPTFGRRQGEAGVRGFFRDVADTLDFHRFEPQEFYEAGDTVIVLGHYEMTVKKTGRRAGSDWVHVFTFRDGKVARFREYADTATFVEAWRG